MLLKLILKNISKRKFIAFLSVFILVIVIFFSSFLNFIYTNIQHILLNETMWQNDKKFILQAKKWSFIGYKLWYKQNLALYYQELKNDKNIQNVYGIYQVNIPVQAIISLLGMNFKTDIIIFSSDKYKQKWKDINIWISPTLLNLYNTQIANNFLPVINETVISTLKVHLTFWKNSFIKYNKTIEKTWHIKKIDNDFPLFGLTIPYNTAEEIHKSLWKWKLKLIKIIWYVKKTSYLKNIEKKYSNKLNIQTISKIKMKINRQTKIVKHIFNVLKYIIYIITISFLVLLALHIYQKNEKNLQVFYYHGANFLQRFNIVFVEMSIYFLIALTINSLIVLLFNIYFINIINKQAISYWLYWIHINWISFLNLFENALLSFIIITIVFLSVFVSKRK